MADQHRWDCIGFNGNKQIKTPHLDALAADGVNYPHTICPFPVCTPSRYSLVSGQYVHQHGGYTNHCTLDPSIATYPRLLRQHGYKTKAVGKMHFTPTYLDVGFEEMELCEQDGDGRYADDYHRALVREGVVDAIDLYDQRSEYRKRAPQEYWDTYGAMTSDLPEEWHSTTWVGDRAVSTLRKWNSQSNLLIASFVKPHHPFDPPAPWSEMYDPYQLELLPGWTESVPDYDPQHAYFDNTSLTEASMRMIMSKYYGAVSHIDHQVGRMVEALRQLNLYDDTMILYLSDHGEYLGFHHMILKHGHPYDPLLRVPLLIKYPGNRHPGYTSDTLANLVDIAPTILQQASVQPAETMVGLNLMDEHEQREYSFSENLPSGFYTARTHTHKLIWDRDPAKSQFFDLLADPTELDNLIDDPASQPLIREFRSAISRWMLFDSPSALRIHEHAPVIRQPNVPDSDSVQRVREQIDALAQSSLAQSPEGVSKQTIDW